MNIHFESALLIAIAPAIITSLIDGFGEWSNSRNFQKAKALEAIRSFKIHVEVRINNPSSDYCNNIEHLSYNELLQIVLFLNQWAVYIINNIASEKVIKQALGHELFLYMFTLYPSANQIKNNQNINSYFQLLSIINEWYNYSEKGSVK